MKQIFINLPVADLEKSMRFYAQMGFSNYPLFTFDDQKCMAWGDQILVMLQSKKFFISGNNKVLLDTKNYIASTFTLPVESIDRVNEIVENSIKAGGIEQLPMIDEGYMKVRTIEDLDGHIWGVLYLNIDKFKEIHSGR
jgi:uncharacterized protein